MYCTKCGRALEQGRCPNCDIVYNDATGVPSDAGQRNSPGAEGESLNTIIETPKEKTPKEKMPKGKKKKLIIIIAAAFLVVAVAGSILAVYLVKDAKYNDAIDMLKKEKLEDAATSFEELESFKNSPDFLEETLTIIDYLAAKEAFDDGDYEDAISMFDDLGKYENSKDLRDLAQQHFDYEAAKVLFDSGALEQAKIAYLTLGTFQDSVAMAESCQLIMDYDEAQSLYQSGQFLAAKNIFDTIPEYQDSKDMAFICDCKLKFDDAVEKVSSGAYPAALSVLKKLETDVKNSSINTDSVVSAKEINYYQGLAYFEQELFYSAYHEFKSASGVLDAASKAGECKQPLKSKELYINPDYTRNTVKLTLHAPKDGTENICVQIYDEGGDLVSTCLIKNEEKVKIYLPSGTYYYKTSYGHNWFGEKEAFGNSFKKVIFEDGTSTFRLSSSYYYWMEF